MRAPAILASSVLALSTLAAATPACSDDDGGSSSSSSSGDLPRTCDVGGAAEAPTGFVSKRNLTVSGVKDSQYGSRTYSLFVPPSHDGAKSFPVVFSFHGNGGDGLGMRRALDLEAASEGGAIVVYPDGFGGWDLESPAAENDDVKFVKAMLDDIASTWCVDRARVFGAGYSNGGFFVNQLACKVGASLFKGIASHAGGGPYGGGSDYDDEGNLVCAGEPVAALVAHGQDDTTVKPSDGEQSRAHWRRVNGCTEGTTAFDPSPCVRESGCASDRPVVYCSVPGLGHRVWPEGGAAATWRFFMSL